MTQEVQTILSKISDIQSMISDAYETMEAMDEHNAMRDDWEREYDAQDFEEVKSDIEYLSDHLRELKEEAEKAKRVAPFLKKPVVVDTLVDYIKASKDRGISRSKAHKEWRAMGNKISNARFKQSWEA